LWLDPAGHWGTEDEVLWLGSVVEGLVDGVDLGAAQRKARQLVRRELAGCPGCRRGDELGNVRERVLGRVGGVGHEIGVGEG
jgi:hypothetical protein